MAKFHDSIRRAGTMTKRATVLSLMRIAGYEGDRGTLAQKNAAASWTLSTGARHEHSRRMPRVRLGQHPPRPRLARQARQAVRLLRPPVERRARAARETIATSNEKETQTPCDLSQKSSPRAKP
jgi:hypothetical protein